MALGMRLDLRQTQSLVMTPQLQQAIRLLQMNNLELGAYVTSEVESNPLLSLPSESVVDTAPEPQASDSAVPADRTPDTPEAMADAFDTGHENLHDATPSDGPSPFGGALPTGPRSDIDVGRVVEERHAESPRLNDHLHAQLGSMTAPETTLRIARYLVEDLDEHGYFRTDPAEIADRLIVPEKAVLDALALIHDCEPTGVGARNVGECLGLQMREQGMLDTRMAVLLDNLGLVASGEIDRLARLCATTAEHVREMIATMRALDPRPCSGFDASQPETLVPDILLRRTDWGGWAIELNPETLPRPLLDRDYAAEFSTSGCEHTREFLTECRANAHWLLRSLDQRAKTIVRIASEIVRQQETFFNEGVTGLRPMTLRDVADAVSVHESTASRVTSNKYIATERGIFELKFFFTNAVGNADSGVSAEAVRHRIKALVERETPKAVLSDDAIVAALKAEGVDLARRTVAKYRKGLGIPSSSARRRAFVASGSNDRS